MDKKYDLKTVTVTNFFIIRETKHFTCRTITVLHYWLFSYPSTPQSILLSLLFIFINFQMFSPISNQIQSRQFKVLKVLCPFIPSVNLSIQIHEASHLKFKPNIHSGTWSSFPAQQLSNNLHPSPFSIANVSNNHLWELEILNDFSENEKWKLSRNGELMSERMRSPLEFWSSDIKLPVRS